ncbi:MAG: XkdX family protein [Peptostreptococcaceae bacterium]
MNKWYFDMAKRYFDLKIYKVDDVRLFVEADRITKEDFKEITGEEFDKPIDKPVLLPMVIQVDKPVV